MFQFKCSEVEKLITKERILQAACVNKQNTELIIDHLLRFPPQNIITAARTNVTVTSLFRLLFIEHNYSEKLTQLAKTLQSNLLNSDNALNLILSQYMKKSEKIVEMPVDKQEISSGVEVIRRCDTVDDVRINEALKDVTNLGEKLAKLLLSDNFEPEKAGLLVDYLSAVELEIVNLKDDCKENVQVKQLVFYCSFFFDESFFLDGHVVFAKNYTIPTTFNVARFTKSQLADPARYRNNSFRWQSEREMSKIGVGFFDIAHSKSEIVARPRQKYTETFTCGRCFTFKERTGGRCCVFASFFV